MRKAYASSSLQLISTRKKQQATSNTFVYFEKQDELQYQAEIKLKSLILAQIERWRHALHMQVERQRGGNPGGERRTGE